MSVAAQAGDSVFPRTGFPWVLLSKQGKEAVFPDFSGARGWGCWFWNQFWKQTSLN